METEAVPRWVGPVFGMLGLVTVPWVVHLAFTLPAREVAAHYRGAWVGFDVGLIVALLTTAYAGWRGRSHIQIPATVSATLLTVDAWFDVMTAPMGRDLAVAVVLAVVVELPLAVVCIWVAHHAELVRRHRLRLPRMGKRGQPR